MPGTSVRAARKIANWPDMPIESGVDLSEPGTIASRSFRQETGKFVRDVFFANLPLPFQKARTYLWLLVFSRFLGPGGFGAWSLFQTTVGMGLIVSSMTQGNAMMRFLPGKRSHEQVSRIFSSVIATVSISSFILALVLACFSTQLSSMLFRDHRGRALLILVALILPLETYFEEMRGLLRARRFNRQWAFFTLARQIPETLLLIALAVLWTRSPVAIAGGYLVTATLSCLFGYAYLARRQQIRLTKPSPAVISRYVPYGLALVPGALAASLSFSADRYLVGYYLDLRQVGIYSVCFTVSALGFFLVAPLNDVLLPEMARLHDAGDWDHFYARFSGVQKVVIGVAMGATALLVSFPREILRVFTTQEFATGAPTLAVLGFQGVFMSIVTLYAVLLCVRLRVWWATAVWAGMGAIILGFDVLLLPRMGIIGAGVSQLISSIVGTALVVGLNWEIFRWSFRLVWIPQATGAVVGVWLLASYTQGRTFSPGQALARIALGATVFLVGLVVTRYVRLGDLLELHRSVVRTRLQPEDAASALGN